MIPRPNQVLERARREPQTLTVSQVIAKWGVDSAHNILLWCAENGSTHFRVGLYTYDLILEIVIDEPVIAL